jgi:hypothetical protein
VIRGFIGEEPGFVGAMRLHGVGDVGPFRVLFSDLKQQNGDQVVPRAHISVTGETSLGDDEYQDVQLKVDGVMVPGTYDGHLELLPHGRPRGEATLVAVTVSALARPTLTAVAPNDRLRGGLAHCGGLGCGVTGVLVPGSAGREKQTVRFTLGSHQQASVTGVEVFGSGERSGHELTQTDLGIDQLAGTTSKNGVLVVPISINPQHLPADHYTGSVHLNLADLDDPVTVPIDFNVRNEPLWALVALLVGILLGRLSNFLQARGRETLNAYKRVRILKGRAERQLDDGDSRKAPLLKKLEQARAAIADDDLDEAKVILDSVESALKDARVPVPTAGLPRAGARGALEKISPVEAGLGFGVHLLGFLVYVGLLVVGFQTLYVNQGASFGSNGIFDYVGLVLWGLTDDVASRSLGNLAGASATAPVP